MVLLLQLQVVAEKVLTDEQTTMMFARPYTELLKPGRKQDVSVAIVMVMAMMMVI